MPQDLLQYPPYNIGDIKPAPTLNMPQAPRGGGAAASASGGLAAGGAIAQGAAGLLGAYNAWESGKLAEKEYEQALKDYQAAKQRQEEIDQINLSQMQLGNVFSGGEFANKLRQQDVAAGQYYQDIGV